MKGRPGQLLQRLRGVPVWPAVLLLGAQRHLGYYWATGADRGMVSKACGAVAILGLMWLLVAREPTRLALVAAGVVSLSELLVIGGCIAYIVSPWPVEPGQDIFGALLGLNVVLAELVLFALVARSAAHVISDRSQADGEN